MLFLCFFPHLWHEWKRDALSSEIGFHLFQLNSNLSSYIPFQNYGMGARNYLWKGRREKRGRKRKGGRGDFLIYTH
jgi:hypothetical protein